MIQKESFLKLALAAFATVGLAGCATPSAGPNAGATGLPPPSQVTKVTVAQEVGAVANNQVEVTFPRGGTTLTPEGNKQLDLAARLFRDASPVVMFTTGYSDRSGDEYANVLLSARRAEVVKRGLVARGIPPGRLLIRANGASELANTADPLSAQNRRVVITWQLL